MWSVAKLRPPPARCLGAPRRAFSSSFPSRARTSPRGPRNSIRRPEPIRRPEVPSPRPEPSNTPPSNVDSLNPSYDPAQNTLLSPVHIPEDPNGVLKETHPATNILANSGLVVQRQLELMNVMIGFEQANKYVILDAHGNHVGYMAEQERGMANMMARQWFRTHRSFVTHVFDRHENEVLRFHRPFSWINSRMRVYDPLHNAREPYSAATGLQTASPGALSQTTTESNARVSPLGFDSMRVIGETQQQWAPLRRKYNLFTYHHSPNPATDMGTAQMPLSQSGLSPSQQLQLSQSAGNGQDLGEFSQFAYVDEPFLSWDFGLRSAENQLIGSVNRDFVGFAREIFTDTGVYALRMDSAGLTTGQPPANQVTGMTLDQRAVMLATAVSVDFDYFSRHSGSGGFGFMPMWFPGMGGEATAGGAAGEAGAVGETAAGSVGRAGAAGGMADGAAAGAAGAGAMAGYDAMNRGMAGENQGQPLPPDQQEPTTGSPPQQSQAGPYGDVWAEEPDQDSWGQDQEDPFESDDPFGDDEGGGDEWF